VDLSQDLESISDVYVQAATSTARTFISPLVEAPLFSACSVPRVEMDEEDVDPKIRTADWDSSSRRIFRPLGKSAYDHLVQKVIDVKRDRIGSFFPQVPSKVNHSPHRRNEYWSSLPVSHG
jgi:hypothetical protein